MSRGPAFFLILLFTAAAATGCEEKIKPSVLTELEGSLAQQESWNSKITISDSGKTKAVIYAGYIRVFESPQETQLSDGVKVHFYDEEGKQSSVLTSERAKVDDVTNNLEAMGNVVVVSEDSTVMKTSKLFWTNQRRLIHTPEFVDIRSPKEKLQGKGFEAEQSLRNYRVFQVTGEARTE